MYVQQYARKPVPQEMMVEKLKGLSETMFDSHGRRYAQPLTTSSWTLVISGRVEKPAVTSDDVCICFCVFRHYLSWLVGIGFINGW